MMAWQIRVRGWAPISIDEIDETGGQDCLEDGSGAAGDSRHDAWTIDGRDSDGDSVGGTGSGDELDAQASVISSGGKGSGSVGSGSGKGVSEGGRRDGPGCDLRGSCLRGEGCQVSIGWGEACAFNCLSSNSLCVIN